MKVPSPTARLSQDGTKIVLNGYSSQLLQFYHSLPEARWHRTQKVWTCHKTPAAASRIVAEGINVDDNVLELAAAYINRCNTTRRDAQRAADANKQPRFSALVAWKHQIASFWFAKRWGDTTGTMLALDMGVGKTKIAIDLLNDWGDAKTLILCPKSVLSVWRREFTTHGGPGWHVVILEKGTVRRKTNEAINGMQLAITRRVRFAVVLNYESAWRPAFRQFALGQQWDCAILDESHRAKAHNSQISKFCHKLGKTAKHRLCLTGTPMPHSPLDVFGQYRFLDPGIFGTSWRAFLDHFARRDNPTIPQQITGYKNEDELKERFAHIAYRVDSSILDLPPVNHDFRTCELSGPAREIYDEMEIEMIAQVKKGVVTASNALVRLLRLQQITSGFVKIDATGKEEPIDLAKQGLLLDLLEDINEPVVVFCRFKHDLRSVQYVTTKLKRSYGELSGSRRDGLTDQGLMAKVDVLGAQIQSGGVGIDLTRARYAIYYSMGYSLGDYIQSLARLHRPGQPKPVFYYHLLARNTIDEQVYTALQKKQDVIDSVLSIFKEA